MVLIFFFSLIAQVRCQYSNYPFGGAVCSTVNQNRLISIAVNGNASGFANWAHLSPAASTLYQPATFGAAPCASEWGFCLTPLKTPASKLLSAIEIPIPAHVRAPVGQINFYTLIVEFRQVSNDSLTTIDLGPWHAIGLDFGAPGAAPSMVAARVSSGCLQCDTSDRDNIARPLFTALDYTGIDLCQSYAFDSVNTPSCQFYNIGASVVPFDSRSYIASYDFVMNNDVMYMSRASFSDAYGSIGSATNKSFLAVNASISTVVVPKRIVLISQRTDIVVRSLSLSVDAVTCSMTTSTKPSTTTSTKSTTTTSPSTTTTTLPPLTTTKSITAAATVRPSTTTSSTRSSTTTPTTLSKSTSSTFTVLDTTAPASTPLTTSPSATLATQTSSATSTTQEPSTTNNATLTTSTPKISIETADGTTVEMSPSTSPVLILSDSRASADAMLIGVTVLACCLYLLCLLGVSYFCRRSKWWADCYYSRSDGVRTWLCCAPVLNIDDHELATDVVIPQSSLPALARNNSAYPDDVYAIAQLHHPDYSAAPPPEMAETIYDVVSAAPDDASQIGANDYDAVSSVLK